MAIAISVGIVTLGMLSALAFFLYKHRAKHPGETQKLVGGNSNGNVDDSRAAPPSSFLYIGTVEPTRTSASEPIRSPYHKLNSVKRSDRYRPSPELQPLPPLTKPPDGNYPPVASPSSSDEESHETVFHSPQNSSLDGYYTPVSRQSYLSNGSPAAAPAKREANSSTPTPVPFSKRTSPKSRFSAPSSDVRHVIIPSIKKAPPPSPPPETDEQVAVGHSRRPKFSAPPPAPNLKHLQSTPDNTPSHPPPPPRPPPPPPPPPPPRKTASPAVSVSSSSVSRKQQSLSPSEGGVSSVVSVRKGSEHNGEKSVSSSERLEANETDGAKPKLKALHWDKVRATSDRVTVWDQLKSSSFQ